MKNRVSACDFSGKEVTHDKSGFYMIFHVNLYELLLLGITTLRLIYMIFLLFLCFFAFEFCAISHEFSCD